MLGWQPLIVCDGIQNPCDIGDFILLIKNGVTDLVLFSTLIFVFMCVISGLRLLNSANNPNALSQTKEMFWKVLMGYMWILAAWLIVYTITSTLIKADFNFFLDNSATRSTQPFTLQ